MHLRAVISLCLCLAVGCSAVAHGFEIHATGTMTPEDGRRLDVVFTVPEAHYLYADEIRVVAIDGGRLVLLDAPAPRRKVDVISGEEMAVYDRDVRFRYAVQSDGEAPIEFEAECLGCNATLCLPPVVRGFRLHPNNRLERMAAPAATLPWLGGDEPEWRRRIDGFTETGRLVGYATPEAFLPFLSDGHARPPSEGDVLSTVLEERGLWVVLLAVLLGGLALNLTPCVLPMIPVNIAVIGAGVEAGSRGRGWLLGFLYGAGIAVVYGVLGVVVILTGARFGALNASAGFNLAVAAVFAVLALATFGVFDLDFTRFQSGLRADRFRKGSFAAAFLLGGIAALLAGACVAPVVIWVLVLAVELFDGGKGYTLALLLPFLLGVGMALPWPFAGAGLSFLPQPGAWMTRVKRVFGVVIMLCALWYGRLGVSLLGPAQNSSAEELVAALDEAASAGKPLLIDFWASWCKSCHKMETTTFRDEAVVASMAEFTVLRFRTDRMHAPEVKPILDHFGVEGLPTYIVLRPKE